MISYRNSGDITNRFKEKVGIKGKVILQKRLIDTPRLKFLEKLAKEEMESGKRLMTDEDKEIWKKAINQEHEDNNLTMTRTIDMVVSLFGRALGFGLNAFVGDDRNSIGNNLTGEVIHGCIPTALGLTGGMDALFPEIVGIGRGISAPAIAQTALDDPFVDAYRNTYNDKFGGYIKPGYTFKDDFICQYAYIYSTDEINDLDFPIYEVALFSPKILVGSYGIRTDRYIDFNTDNAGYLTNNRLWSGLNVSCIYRHAGNTYINTRYREQNRVIGFSTNRIEQEIEVTLAPVPVPPDPDARAIVAFTPRYDSIAAVAGQWGSTDAFGLGNMLARIILPVGFIKNQNESLTVIWQMYFTRLS